ncbi:MAG TPA: AarF/ABC1/UbiB kinase family protein [Candidatus Brachybacterium merdavium]|uniref:AarF/ABC1/UbiB kinase family protein n=1 Tax=Candidatus Brachybacterium merdavium TaxID=2838513 RepID=A0A9D2RPL6_9MICO|nr:AarF/ABC1/UbiB kinase family protein [Candidatus Brachybacterium merdavium]
MAPDPSRYRRIAEVLVRNGLSALAAQIGLRDHAPEVVRRRLADAGTADGPARLRRALEELGPTFVKLGQMLSTRRDLLPIEYTQELEHLRAATGAVPYSQVAEVIERELGRPPRQAYAWLEERPLASASIGQAHRGRLHDGTEVIVKVRKPGVREDVLADLELMRSLAALMSREWELARDVDVVSLVAAFDRTMRGELDYRNETAHATQMRSNLAGDPAVQVPGVIEELTTAEVLTEEYVEGMRIDDTAALDASGIDRPALAERATETLVRMVLVDGFFHADPHPGNMFVDDAGVITLIDFGMVGRLSESVREDLLHLLLALSRQDHETAVSALVQLAPPRTGGLDRRHLTRDVAALMESLSAQPLAEVPISTVLEHITALLRRHRLQLPADVSTLLRMLVLTESTAVILDPSFHLSGVLAQVVPVAMMQLLRPEAIARRLRAAGASALRVGSELPARANRLLDDYEARGVDVRLHPEDLDRIVHRLEGTADRLIVGMTMSALLVGISSVIAAQPGRVRVRDPLMLASGGATALLGTYLAAGAGPARRLGRLVRRGIAGR